MRARSQAEDCPSGRVDIHDAAHCINNDHAIIDVAQYRQDGDVGVRKALLQAPALYRVIKDCVLSFDSNVVNANISQCPGPQGGNAAMFVFFLCQRDNREWMQRMYQLSQRLPGVGNDRSRFQ